MKRIVLAAMAIAAAAAFFASTYPDGLAKTAQVLGFAGMAKDHPSLTTGYSFVSGIAGVLIIFAVFWSLAYGLRILKNYSRPPID